jgi:hypothetical protein
MSTVFGRYGVSDWEAYVRDIGSFMTHILVLAFLIVEACAADPSDTLKPGPWKGRIVDIETKEPIEGAVVVAVWERVYGTPAGPNSYFYEAKEVVTDKEGRFEIPAYRPINLLPLISSMRGPAFTIFKPGYLSLSNRHLEENVIDKPAEFTRDEKTYKLAPGLIELPGLKTREERLKAVSLPPTVPDDKMPKLIDLMNREAVALGLKPSHLPGDSK